MEVIVKRSLSALVTGVCLAILPGCVTSENGLCAGDERGAVFDASLLGEWMKVPPAGMRPPAAWPTTIRFERDRPESKAYRFTEIPSSRGPDSVSVRGHKAYLVRLADTLFLDYILDMPDEPPGMPEDLANHKLHLIARVARPRESELRLFWLRSEYIKRHPKLLRHSDRSRAPFEWIDVTASTQELIAFCRENARNAEAWNEPGDVWRRR
jgi:hypothetical protein